MRFLTFSFLLCSILIFAQILEAQDPTISSAEFFIDTDPGQGNGTPVPPSDGSFDQDIEELDFSINTSSLAPGKHTVHTRLQDSKGNWGKSIAFPIVIQHYDNQQIIKAEYFIDNDPGRGNGTQLNIAGTSNSSATILEGTINTNSLANGLHTLFVRIADSYGNWGPRRSIYIKIDNDASAQPIFLSKAEYFLDTDPGLGNGTLLAPTDGDFESAVEDVEGAINTSDLTIGDHQVYIRFADQLGIWGETDSSLVTILLGTNVDSTRNSEIPKEFNLSQNYPNPTNSSTIISYSLPHTTHVSLRVYNYKGQVVRTLINSKEEAGKKIITWNCQDEQGNPCASGQYFISLKAGKNSFTKKVVLLR